MTEDQRAKAVAISLTHKTLPNLKHCGSGFMASPDGRVYRCTVCNTKFHWTPDSEHARQQIVQLPETTLIPSRELYSEARTSDLYFTDAYWKQHRMGRLMGHA